MKATYKLDDGDYVTDYTDLIALYLDGNDRYRLSDLVDFLEELTDLCDEVGYEEGVRIAHEQHTQKLIITATFANHIYSKSGVYPKTLELGGILHDLRFQLYAHYR